MDYERNNVTIKAADTDIRMPYENLFIYILKGRVPAEDERILGKDFLGNWVEDDQSFLFFKEPADETVQRFLETRPCVSLMETHMFKYEEWQGGGLLPIKTADFVIVPPWKSENADQTGLRIQLDPGVVFGSGLHPTTRDCLKAIALTNQKEPIKNALDLGTGTGVLALAVSVLGAARVEAVDLNPLCIRTAENNVRLNGMEDRVHVALGSAEKPIHWSPDLVIANIHYEVIKRLWDEGSFSKGKRWIVSGLLRSQFREVRHQMQRAGFEIVAQWDHEMTWFTVLGNRS